MTKICKDCKWFEPNGTNVSGTSFVEGMEVAMRAECAASTYQNYVTGTVYRYSCKNINDNGNCKKFENKEGLK